MLCCAVLCCAVLCCAFAAHALASSVTDRLAFLLFALCTQQFRIRIVFDSIIHTNFRTSQSLMCRRFPCFDLLCWHKTFCFRFAHAHAHAHSHAHAHAHAHALALAALAYARIAESLTNQSMPIPDVSWPRNWSDIFCVRCNAMLVAMAIRACLLPLPAHVDCRTGAGVDAVAG
jgi:hypothetical protein